MRLFVARALVALLVILLTVLATPARAISVGGSGSGLYFSRERCDVLGVGWLPGNMPTRSFTIEAWVRLVDTANKDHVLLAYSEFDGSSVPRYDNPDGIQIRFRNVGTRMYRGESVSCSTGCVLFGKGWTHYATTWDTATGIAAQWVNGTLRSNNTKLGVGQFGSPLTQDGSMFLGQEADAFAGLFDEGQALDGLVDELRVWDHVRSPAEIQQSLTRSFDHLSAADMRAQGLALYYNFDDATQLAAGVAADVTEQGNSGYLGHLQNHIRWCTYGTLRAEQMPTSPKPVLTSASHQLLLPGNQPLVHHVAPAISATSRITLRAYSELVPASSLSWNIVGSLPSHGTLTELDGVTAVSVGVPLSAPELLYTVTDPLAFTSDSFVYQAADGTDSDTATVNIRLHPMESPPARSFRTDVDHPITLALGTVLSDGHSPIVVITTLPEPVPANPAVTGAAVYNAAFLTPSAPFYSEAVTSVTGRTPLLAGAIVPNERGAVMFAPPTIGGQVPSAVSVRFGYRYRHPLSGDTSAEAFVTVRVAPVDRAPVVTPMQKPVLQLDLDTAPQTSSVGLDGAPVNSSYGLVALTATDVDSSFSGLLLHRVSRLPKLGALYQVDAVSRLPLTGLGALSADANLAEVSTWATRALNASSQYYANCPAECALPWNCDYSRCSSLAYTISHIVGPADCYPSFGDCSRTYQPSTKNDGVAGGGREWIEVQMGELPIYVSSIEVYETMSPGAVVRVATASAYDGPNTQWTEVWSGPPNTLLPAAARVFSPSICQLAHEPVLYLRVEYRTDLFPGSWSGLDALRWYGSLVPPPGRVTDLTSARVAYVPFPGVFPAAGSTAPFDQFAYRPNDCVAEASADTMVDVFLSGGVPPVPVVGAVPSSSDLVALRASKPFREPATLLLLVPGNVDASDTAVAGASGGGTEQLPFDLGLLELISQFNSLHGSNATLDDVEVLLVDLQALGGGDAAGGIDNAPADSLPSLMVLNANGAVACDSSSSACRATALTSPASGSSFTLLAQRSSSESTSASSALFSLSAYVTLRGQYSYLLRAQVLVDQGEMLRLWSAEDNRPYTVAVSVLAGVVLVYILAMSGAVLKFREHAVFRAASPAFCFVILAGAGIACLYCIVSAQYAPSASSCLGEMWLGHVAYALAVGVTLAKVWRVNRIFNQSKIAVVKISNSALAIRVVVGMAIVLLYLIIWSAVAAPAPATLRLGNTVYTICESSSGAWPNVLLGLEGAVLLWGVLLSVQQRNTPDMFSEASACAISLYNTAVLGAISVGFVKSSLLSSGPVIALFQQLAVLLCTVILVSALFVSKLLFVYGVRAAVTAGGAANVSGKAFKGNKLAEGSILSDGSSSGGATGTITMGAVTSAGRTVRSMQLNSNRAVATASGGATGPSPLISPSAQSSFPLPPTSPVTGTGTGATLSTPLSPHMLTVKRFSSGDTAPTSGHGGSGGLLPLLQTRSSDTAAASCASPPDESILLRRSSDTAAAAAMQRYVISADTAPTPAAVSPKHAAGHGAAAAGDVTASLPGAVATDDASAAGAPQFARSASDEVQAFDGVPQ